MRVADSKSGFIKRFLGLLSIWIVALSMGLSIAHPSPAFSAEKDGIYEAEPWYEANPISRLIFSYFAAGYNLLRVDRIGNPEESYSDGVINSLGTAAGRTLGILGESANDLSRLFFTLTSAGTEDEDSILQCTSILPAGSAVVGGITQMKHTWLQVGNKSYGMPFTLDGGYFGGPAGIFSPDPFLRWQKTPSGVICTPIRFPKHISKNDRIKDTKCIASKLSVGDMPNIPLEVLLDPKRKEKPSRGTVVDYNAFTNNCLSAVKYIVSCAGGEISQSPNLGIGGAVPWEKEAFRLMRRSELEPVKAKSKINELIFLVGEMKSLSFQLSKSRSQNESFIRSQMDGLRTEIKDRLTSHPDLGDQYSDSLRELQRLNLDEDTPYTIAKGVEHAITRINMRLLGEVSGVEKTTYQDACETARSACGL